MGHVNTVSGAETVGSGKYGQLGRNSWVSDLFIKLSWPGRIITDPEVVTVFQSRSQYYIHKSTK